MDSKIVRHVKEINRCNQRGGRMLSVRDLLDAGTLDRKMAAYLLAAINKGKSFLVGANPGGSGKTTVMAALLNFIPDVEIVPTDSSQVIQRGFVDEEAKCFLAHEIGRGRWFAYIWGKDVADFLRLTKHHMVASNLHADDIDDVLASEGIDEDNITNLDILVFLRVRRVISGTKRRIGAIFENQNGRGRNAFKQIFTWDEVEDRYRQIADPKLVGPHDIKRAENIIEKMIELDLRSVEEVRTFILDATKDPHEGSAS